MPVPTSAKCGCRHCGTHLEFPVELAGTQVDCPHCGHPTALELPAPEPSPTPAVDPLADILAAFTGSVPRTRVPWLYQIGLVLVAVVMVLLPLVYLAMVAGVAWLLYHFARGGLVIARSVGGVVLYVALVVTGLITLVFLFKPLFARRAPRAQPLALNPAVERTLFAFIARVCATVGAPLPARIDLNCELNASAGFRRGLLSFLGNDLVLTIGLPLVAGLNLREFAGVLAHEFGHFTQGGAMRLFYVIRGVNEWFARLVYERDAWDVWLAEWAADAESGFSAFIASSANLGVGLARLLLRVPMYLGHAVSALLSRQMEYDADHYEIHLAGSATFASAFHRLHLLGRATKRAYEVLGVMWKREHRLPQNLPAFVLEQEAQLTQYVRTKVDLGLAQERTGWLDTHPSYSDRLRRARAVNAPGIFTLEIPATALFNDFETLAGQITFLHYTDDLRLPALPALLTHGPRS